VWRVPTSHKPLIRTNVRPHATKAMVPPKTRRIMPNVNKIVSRACSRAVRPTLVPALVLLSPQLRAAVLVLPTLLAASVSSLVFLTHHKTNYVRQLLREPAPLHLARLERLHRPCHLVQPLSTLSNSLVRVLLVWWPSLRCKSLRRAVNLHEIGYYHHRPVSQRLCH
jgi:hypothetical protein